MTDNETRYREALEEIFDEGRHDMAWQIAKNALNPPQEPQFEEVEVVKYWCPQCDVHFYDCAVGEDCNHDRVRLTGTYRRPVKPKVKRRVGIDVVGTKWIHPDSTIPNHAKLFAEWEE